MKIAIVGASGTLGKAIVAELKPRHEIVAVGRNSGDFHADQRDIKSLQFGVQAHWKSRRNYLCGRWRAFRSLGGIDARQIQRWTSG